MKLYVTFIVYNSEYSTEVADADELSGESNYQLSDDKFAIGSFLG